jgi:putative peptide zinc metalloprotease protein
MKNSPSASARCTPSPDGQDDASLDLIAAAFAEVDLSDDELTSLLAGAENRHVLAGTVIANEGDDGACFVVRAGLLSLARVHNGVERIVGTAAAGDVVGSETLRAETVAPFGSAVVATSDVDLLALDAAAVRRLIDDNPAFARLVRDRAERALLEQLVRATTSFDGVSSADLRALVQSVERRRVAAGEAIVVQGDDADEAFVIVEGAVDVIDESTQRVLATLRNGALFGETALINEDHRNATVRAHDDTALLVLRREPFLNIVRSNTTAKSRMIDLLNSRDRPLRRATIEVTRQIASDGSEIAVLKNPLTHSYFRLAGESVFLWERFDGTHTIRDLATALFMERHLFAPHVVIDTVRNLRSRGFVESNSSFTAEGVADDDAGASPFDRFARAAQRALTATAHFHDVDAAFGTIYRAVARPLFTWPAAAIMAVIALAGMVFFALATPHAVAVLWTPHGFVSFALLLLPAYALLIVLHELGHGLAVKAVGRSVESVGVGWYWFGPIAFVDTSDAWAATRMQRVLVSASGLVMNLLLAAIASTIAFTVHQSIVAVAAWQFALTAYIGVIENLNPLLEFDGYYMLVDLLDRPNLRRQSLGWMGTHLRDLVRRPSVVHGHGIEFAYAIGAFGYIIFAAGQSLLFYHFVGEQRLAHIIPAHLAAIIAWVFPIVLAAAAFAALLAEMRRVTGVAAR